VQEVPLRVVAVQPDIPQTDKFDPNAEDRVLDQLGKLTDLAVLSKPARNSSSGPSPPFRGACFPARKITTSSWTLVQKGTLRCCSATSISIRKKRRLQLRVTAHGARHRAPKTTTRCTRAFGEYLPLRPVSAIF